jgi:hypothetical protein
MTDAEAIEAAAIAIHATFAMKSGRGRPWAEIPETLKREYRAEARSALIAIGMIEPAVDQCTQEG